MSDVREPTNRNGIGTEGRDARGRFAPGNSGGPGRPTLARELEVFEAARRGAPAEVIQGVVEKLAELALAGDVAASRVLLQARGLLGREEPAPAVEVGESLARVLERPGAADRIAKLMDEVFAPSGEANA